MDLTKAQVNRAGESLRQNPTLEAGTAEVLLLISAWRSGHEQALKRVMSTLRRHTQLRGWDTVISGRTKRIRSIVSKLIREPKMKLSRMQDIGGCRAVMENVENVEQLGKSICSELKDSLSAGGKISGHDYIASPKSDGYRSLHFVVRYESKRFGESTARSIEIQIRSKLQHRWATALETVDLFTGQTLKSGGGDPRWRRFFALASSIFAAQENRALVPGTPSSLSELTHEMNAIARELCVVARLQGWSAVMRSVLDDPRSSLRGIYCYLVELDVKSKTTHVTPFRAEDLGLAHQRYLASERANASDPDSSTVLVKAYSLAEVQEAFPGFYGDTKAFLRAANLI